jgi:predicted Mrr-cat superfamily restriction endonuclease
MRNGVVLIPVSDDYRNISKLYDGLRQGIDVAYVGDEISDLEGELKNKFILAEYKRFLALNRRFILCSFMNDTLKNRRCILELATQANYYKLGLVIDTVGDNTILQKSLDYDEGFDQILVRN